MGGLMLHRILCYMICSGKLGVVACTAVGIVLCVGLAFLDDRHLCLAMQNRSQLVRLRCLEHHRA
ncbi:MAG: hypothetical protein J07HQX50_00266 [Haloquadratum sp. J07HQX50]|nr:MAG: hypothetical protein J07HQX50_00266 [Haloquadratum sp. J07HQX50]